MFYEGDEQMFIINVEGAIRKDGKWIIVERSMKEDHAGGGLALVGGKVEAENNTPNILEKTVKREIAEEIGITKIALLNRLLFIEFN